MQRPEQRQPYASPLFPPADVLKLAVAALRIHAQVCSEMMQYPIETLSFLKHRLEQDLNWMYAVCEGEEFSDSFDLLSEFVQNATADYAAETARIAGLRSKVASATAKRLRKQADMLVEEMALRTVS